MAVDPPRPAWDRWACVHVSVRAMTPPDRIDELGSTTSDDVSAGVRSVGVGAEHQQPRGGRRPQRQETGVVADLSVTDRRASSRASAACSAPPTTDERRHRPLRPASDAARRPGRPPPPPPAMSAAPRPVRASSAGRSACAGPASSRSTPASMAAMAAPADVRLVDGGHVQGIGDHDTREAHLVAQQVTQDGRRPQRGSGSDAAPVPARGTRRGTPSPSATPAVDRRAGTAPARVPPGVAASTSTDRQAVMRVRERLAAAREMLGGGGDTRGLQALDHRGAAAGRASSGSSPNERAPTAGLRGSVARSQVGCPGHVAAHGRQLPAHRAPPPVGPARTDPAARDAPCCPRRRSPARRRPCSWPPSWSMATMAVGWPPCSAARWTARLSGAQLRRRLDVERPVQRHARGVAGTDAHPAPPAAARGP